MAAGSVSLLEQMSNTCLHVTVPRMVCHHCTSLAVVSRFLVCVLGFCSLCASAKVPVVHSDWCHRCVLPVVKLWGWIHCRLGAYPREGYGN